VSDDATAWREGILAALGREQERSSALDSLIELPPRARDERIDATLAGALVLLLGDPSRTRQRRAADVLQALVPDAPRLAEALDSALAALDPRLRWGAAYTLGHARTPPPAHLWPAVRETLALRDGDQRWAAAELACELARHHPHVREDMVTTIADGSPTLRRMFLYCLRDLEDADLLPVARARLEDHDPRVRLAALSASAAAERTTEETEALAHRVASLMENDADDGVRRAAAATLGKLGTTSDPTLAALERAAESSDASLARAATLARGRLTAKSGPN